MMTVSQGEATTAEEHFAPPPGLGRDRRGLRRVRGSSGSRPRERGARARGARSGRAVPRRGGGTGGSQPARRTPRRRGARHRLVARDDRTLRGARPRGEPEQGRGAGDGLSRSGTARTTASTSPGHLFGVMLVPDQSAGAARDGAGDEARWASARHRLRPPRGARVPPALHQRAGRPSRPGFPGLPDDPPPLEFQVSAPGGPAPAADRRGSEGRAAWSGPPSGQRSTSGQEMWDWVLHGNPIPGMLVADLAEDRRARLRQVLDGMLRERARGRRTSRTHECRPHRHRDEVAASSSRS